MLTILPKVAYCSNDGLRYIELGGFNTFLLLLPSISIKWSHNFLSRNLSYVNSKDNLFE